MSGAWSGVFQWQHQSRGETETSLNSHARAKPPAAPARQQSKQGEKIAEFQERDNFLNLAQLVVLGILQFGCCGRSQNKTKSTELPSIFLCPYSASPGRPIGTITVRHSIGCEYNQLHYLMSCREAKIFNYLKLYRAQG